MELKFTTHYLDNGLKVLIHEDHYVPKAIVDVLYKVGARNEHPQRTGLAHLFEHLMFRGSKHIQFYDQHVQRIGGECNAFTTEDFTNYYITLPANQLETAFWLESDRMLALDLSSENIQTEKSVVVEEFKQRYLNQPYGDADLLLRPLHFTTHPYRWKTIGKELAHIEEASEDDIFGFYENFYAPANATLIVVGDVQTEEVLQLAEKWFGPIPGRPVHKPDLPAEPRQEDARELTVHRPVPYPTVYKSFHAPGFRQPDFFVADLLTDLLSGGKSARLYQRMVREKQVASTVSAYCWGLQDDGLIYIVGRVAEDSTIEAYEAALQEVIDELAEISPEEVEGFKNKKESMEYFEKTSLQNRAIAFAFYDTIDQPELINQLLSIYKAITIEDLQATRTETLRPDNCSTLYYLPESA